MKKQYTLMTLTLMVGLTASAQKRALEIPAKHYPDHYLSEVERISEPTSDTHATPTPNRPQGSTTAVDRGGFIWSEDFGNGFPEGWVVDDLSGINPWKWSLNGSHGNFNGTNASGYADPINSTTADNGFLINDPDSANHFTNGQPSGTTYQYLESYFATSEIDLGASYPSLILEFEQSFRFNNSVDMIVQVSSDSANWTDFSVQGDVANNTASDDPDLVRINISGAIAGAETVYLRIGWSARVYFWMIDDMRIVEGLENDLALTKAYHGDIMLDYQYSRIPLEQTTEMVVGAIVTNEGGNIQYGVEVDYDVLLEGSSVHTGSFAFPEDMAPAAVDTVWHETGFTPTEVGAYELVMTVASDSTDENTDNQSGSSSFEVTEFVFGHDYEDQFEVQVWGQEDENGEANPYSHGNVFIPYNPGSTLYALQVGLGSNTTPNTSVIVEVLELGASIQDVVETYQSVFDILPEHVNGGSNFFYTTMVLEDEIPLNAGTGYTVAVRSEGGEDELWVLGNSGDEDFSTVLYGPYGTGGATNWYTAWQHTPAVRMNLNPNISSVRERTEAAVFSVFPNPADDLVTISLAGTTERLQLFDMTGKLVSDLTPKLTGGTSMLRVPVGELNAGIYLLSGESAQGTQVSKLIVH